MRRHNPLEMFPPEWLVDATLKRGGGKDKWGNPTPFVSIPLPGCLFAPRSTSDPVDRSDLTDSRAVLYAPPGTEVASTDRVEVPGHGTYAVDGEASYWPLGVEIPLRGEHG